MTKTCMLLSQFVLVVVVVVWGGGDLKPSDNVAEWSKVPDSSSGGEIRVGSNPTVVMQCTAK